MYITSVSPGGIEDNQPESFVRAYQKDCNSKGLLTTNDVTDTLIFLLSDAGDLFHGQNIIIDDGWSL